MEDQVREVGGQSKERKELPGERTLRVEKGRGRWQE